MGYWEEKQNYEESKPIKIKCPKNSKIEVTWIKGVEPETAKMMQEDNKKPWYKRNIIIAPSQIVCYFSI